MGKPFPRDRGDAFDEGDFFDEELRLTSAFRTKARQKPERDHARSYREALGEPRAKRKTQRAKSWPLAH